MAHFTSDGDLMVFGSTYEIKEHDGYKFASDNLWCSISDTEEEDAVDPMIAYYFEPEVFNAHTAEELYEIFNKHS